MRPIYLPAFVLAALALGIFMISGCTTTASRIDTAAADHDICIGWGVAPGSEAYVACRMQQQSMHRVDRSLAVEESYAIRQATSEFADNFARAVTGVSPY